MVIEYETNPIAADSDDEKKMYRAQMRAENFTSILRNFETKMYFEVDNNLSNICSPVGRLKSKVSEWEENGANKSIVQLIKVGYKILSKPSHRQ